MPEIGFNRDVRDLYKKIIKHSIRNTNDPDEIPMYAGGGRFREYVKTGSDPYYPQLNMKEAIGLSAGYIPEKAITRITKKVKEHVLMNHPEIAEHIINGGKFNFKKELIKHGHYEGGRRNAGVKNFFNKLVHDSKPVVQRVVKQVGRTVVPALERVGQNALNKGTMYLENQANNAINNAVSGGKIRITHKGDLDYHEDHHDIKKSHKPYANNRGEIVKKVMREQGLSLGAASKYVKQNGLY